MLSRQAYNPQVIGETYKRHRHQEVLKFLRKVEKAVPKD